MKELMCDGADIVVGLRSDEASALVTVLEEVSDTGALDDVVKAMDPVIMKRFGQLLLASPVLRELFAGLRDGLKDSVERKYDVSGRFTVTYDVEAEGVVATSEEHAEEIVQRNAHLGGSVLSPHVSLGDEGELDRTYLIYMDGDSAMEVATVALSEWKI